MKKHLALILVCAFAAIVNVQAQSLTSPRTQVPEVTVQKIRKVAEEQFSIFNNRDNDYDRDYCDCDKCQKQKKSKKHDNCKGNGNHYGKHKNHHSKNSCSCDHNCCQSKKKHDCGDDDHWSDRNRNGRDDDDRRYTSTRRDRDDDNRQQPQAGQRTPTAKVKSRPAPTTTRPTPATKPVAKRKVTTRPVGTRQ